MQPHFTRCCHYSLRNDVASHDATEYIAQYGLQPWIAQHQLECFRDFFSGCASPHVEKIGRVSSVEFDDIHGSHRKTGAIYQATYIAIERNVGKTISGRLDFRRILLV